MTVTKSDIVCGLKQWGLKYEDSVLIHSSLSSFGYVEGGAAAVIEALRETVGNEGSVLVPTLTGAITDTSSHPPVFDVRTSVCWTGKIPETLRRNPRAKRSLHPTHSVAGIGGKTESLLTGHEKGSSPCDQYSPYYKNAAAGGYILLAGVDQESNTTVHCCEELAGVPYHLQQDIAAIPITGYNGETIVVHNRLHNWHKHPTDFNKFDGILQERGAMKTGKIGFCTVRLISAAAMLEICVGILKKQPEFLFTQD